MRLSANLSFLFQELPMEQRIAAAAECGFRGVEYMFPYDYDVAALRRQLDAGGVEQVLFNLPAGDFAKGERGIAGDPARAAEFARGVADAARVAGELRCTRVNCLVGIARPEVDAATARATLVSNLRHAANVLGAAGVTLLVEPLNRIETPGFLIGTSAEALALIAEVGAPNLKLQYDIYHAQRVEGNILATLRSALPSIGHVQIADSPARNEPGTGELAYERILPELDRIGYGGWVGLEYKPSRPTRETFGWIETLRAQEVPA